MALTVGVLAGDGRSSSLPRPTIWSAPTAPTTSAIDLRPAGRAVARSTTATAACWPRSRRRAEPVAGARSSPVPSTVIDSVLAVEDQHFYEHKGVNIRSIVRAAVGQHRVGRGQQGGSTITQQLVKNSLVGNEQDFSRKIREAVLAVELEKQMTKDADPRALPQHRVLRQRRLRRAGGGRDLLQQGRRPARTGPRARCSPRSIRSPNAVRPVPASRACAKRAPRPRVPTRSSRPAQASPRTRSRCYRRCRCPTDARSAARRPTTTSSSEVKQQLLDDTAFGLRRHAAGPLQRSVFQGGLRVYTTFDPAAQLLALRARNEPTTVPGQPRRRHVPDSRHRRPSTGKPNFGTEAIVSVEPSTGAVRVMVGGPGSSRIHQFDLATQSRPPARLVDEDVRARALFEQRLRARTTR